MRTKLASKLLCLLALLGYFTAISWSGGSLIDCAKYLGYVLLMIYLPGSLALRLFKIDLNPYLAFVLSFFLGYALSVLIYILGFKTDTYGILKWVPMVLGILELVNFFVQFQKKGIESSSLDKLLRSPLMMFLSLIIIILTAMMVLPNPTAYEAGIASYYQDFIWHIANSSAFERSFPPISPQFDGWHYQYHYFNVLYLAIAKATTGIHAFDQTFYYAPLVHAIILSCCLFGFADYFIKEKKFRWIFPFGLLAFNCSSLWWAAGNGHGQFLNVHFYHLITNVNGQGSALAILMVLTGLLFSKDGAAPTNLKKAALSLTLLTLLMGVKGPVAMLFIAAFGLTQLYQLTVSRRDNRGLVLLIAYCAIFILFYKLLFSERVATTVQFLPGKMLRFGMLGSWLASVDASLKLAVLLSSLLIPVHFLLYHPIISIPFLHAVWRSLKRFRTIPITKAFFILLALCGFGLAYLVDHSPGNSQVYFMMTATPFALILGINQISESECWLTSKGKSALALMVLVSLTTTGSILWHYIGSTKKIMEASKSEIEVPQPRHNAITRFEWESMKWLELHSPVDAVFATDRILKNPDDPRYFYYTAFSSRQAFLAGYFYVRKGGQTSQAIHQRRETNASLFALEADERGALMTANGINYLVVSRFSNPELFSIALSGVKRVFENRDVHIYVPLSVEMPD